MDNVRFEGDRQQCDPLGVNNPPNGVGDTLLLDKVGGELEATWNASPVDGSHDAPAYYEVWASGDPSGGFTVADTSTTTTVQRQLAPTTEFYVVVAVNSSGTSGDEPTP